MLAAPMAKHADRKTDDADDQHARDPAMDLLDHRVVATGEEPPVARGPVRAPEPGLGRAHERADGHQRPAERDERGGE